MTSWLKIGIDPQYLPQRRVRTALSFAAIPLVGYLHYLIGVAIEFHPFFLLTIIAATWYGGPRAGVLAALCSVAIWLWIDWRLLAQSVSGVAIFNHVLHLCVFLMVIFYVDQWNAAMRRENQLARSDSLTGLANHRAFFALATVELARARRNDHAVAVVFIDLDGFKAVNDTLGHAVGDELLRAVAEVLRSRSRATDICARMGGDEFVLLLSETGAEAAEEFAVTLKQLLLEAMRRHGWPATFSIGVAVFNTLPDEVDQLVSHADALMYAVKQSGKNNIRIEVL